MINSCLLADRGCPAAAVRVFKDAEDMPVDMCGETLPSDQLQIMSKGSLLRMNFLAAARAVGAKGFKVIWTEVQDSKSLSGRRFKTVSHGLDGGSRQ